MDIVCQTIIVWIWVPPIQKHLQMVKKDNGVLVCTMRMAGKMHTLFNSKKILTIKQKQLQSKQVCLDGYLLYLTILNFKKNKMATAGLYVPIPELRLWGFPLQSLSQNILKSTITFITKKNKIMTTFSKILTTIASTFLFASCTKNINIPIKDVDKKLVIEAEIGNQPNQCVVKLSKTINYSLDNIFPGVTNATVIITDNKGNTFNLLDANNDGTYTNSTVVGIPGYTYNLNITAEGKTYTSTCKMAAPIAIDSIRNDSLFLLGNSIKVVKILFTDDAAITNYYRYFVTANGVRKGKSEVLEDLFINGVQAPLNLPSRGPQAADSTSFIPGTRFGVTLQSIQKSVFTYFNSKSQNTNGQSGAPANPETNITGGALGYFNAYTSDYKETIIK
jgi:Domain of unknown function (DUF4249)